jgi:hypothetical protein
VSAWRLVVGCSVLLLNNIFLFPSLSQSQTRKQKQYFEDKNEEEGVVDFNRGVCDSGEYIHCRRRKYQYQPLERLL